MCVAEARASEREREREKETKIIFYVFILNVASLAHVSKKKNHFYVLYSDE